MYILIYIYIDQYIYIYIYKYITVSRITWIHTPLTSRFSSSKGGNVEARETGNGWKEEKDLEREVKSVIEESL